jgi:hypothetical protein
MTGAGANVVKYAGDVNPVVEVATAKWRALGLHGGSRTSHGVAETETTAAGKETKASNATM